MSCQTEAGDQEGFDSSAIVMPMLRRIEAPVVPDGEAVSLSLMSESFDVVHDDEFIEDVLQALGLLRVRFRQGWDRRSCECRGRPGCGPAGSG